MPIDAYGVSAPMMNLPTPFSPRSAFETRLGRLCSAGQGFYWACGQRRTGNNSRQEFYMSFRKIALAFLMMTVSAASAYAKKEPKYEAVHPLTPEQSALVDRAISQ